MTNRVLLLDPNNHAADLAKRLFPEAEFFRCNDIDSALKQDRIDVCIAGIILTKCSSLSDAAAIVRLLSQRFATVLFFEPCSLNHDRLLNHGFCSFHAKFSGNRSFGSVGFDFLKSTALDSPISQITHHGIDPAEDTLCHWIVDRSHPANVLPINLPESQSKNYKYLGFPLFQYSLFACSRFDGCARLELPGLSLVLSEMISSNVASAMRWMTSADDTFINRNRGAEILVSPETPAAAGSAPTVEFGSSLSRDLPQGLQLASAVAEYRRSFTANQADLRCLEIDDAVVCGSGLVIGREGVAVDSCYLFEIINRSIWGAIGKGLAKQVVHRDVDYQCCIVGLNTVSGNYYHWLAQCLVSITLGLQISAKKQHDGPILVVVPRLKTWQRASLTALLALHPGVDFVEVGLTEFVRVRNAMYINALGANSPFAEHVGRREMASAIKRSLELSPRQPEEIIYISRRDTNLRPMTNELALIAALEDRGVRCVLMSELTFRGQVELMHGARLVIGPHGSGLANILFAQPGAALYELHHSLNLNSCMLRLAQSAGVNYICDIFGSDQDVLRGRWKVDIDIVLMTLDRALENGHRSGPGG